VTESFSELQKLLHLHPSRWFLRKLRTNLAF